MLFSSRFVWCSLKNLRLCCVKWRHVYDTRIAADSVSIFFYYSINLLVWGLPMDRLVSGRRWFHSWFVGKVGTKAEVRSILFVKLAAPICPWKLCSKNHIVVKQIEWSACTIAFYDDFYSLSHLIKCLSVRNSPTYAAWQQQNHAPTKNGTLAVL